MYDGVGQPAASERLALVQLQAGEPELSFDGCGLDRGSFFGASHFGEFETHRRSLPLLALNPE